jgi:FkbM family methyltransferase
MLKRLVKAALGRDLLVTTQVQCPRQALGNQHAQWIINPELLGAESIVYSFGIGEDISFDLALIDRFGVTVHAFDPTPRSIQWLRTIQLPNRFVPHQVGLSDRDGNLTVFAPENPNWVSFSNVPRATPATEIPVKRLSTIMRELGHDHIDVLKLDIEGAEYQALPDIISSGILPAQLLVEVHHRFNGVSVSDTKRLIRLLSQNDYAIFNVSDSGEEYSFIQRNAVERTRIANV